MNESGINSPVRVEEQKDYDPRAIAEKAAAMFTADGIDPKGRSVFILYCADWSWDRASVGVNPLFVIGVVEGLASLGAGEIAVADPAPPRMKTSHSEFTGLYRKRLGSNAHFISLTDARRVRMKISAPLVHEEFKVPSVCLKSDIFIVITKAKTSILTEVSTTATTMLQLLVEKERYQNHDYRMQMKLADVYGIRRPDYAMYDAIMCGEGQGPLYSEPKELGLIVGGANAVNADAVMCRLMGFVPQDIDHLRLLADMRAGMVNMKSITVLPAGAAGKMEKFRKANWNIEGANENARVVGGGEYYCASGCAGLARQALEPWLGGDKLQKPAHFIIGKPIGRFIELVDRKRTLVIGDCAECHSGLGKFVPGCPPNPNDIELALLEVLKTPGARSVKLRIARRLGAPGRWLLEHARSRAFHYPEPFSVSIAATALFSAQKSAKRATVSVKRKFRRKKHY
ncbi:MAG: DUF362 domain-containing protein [bacterium]